MRITISREEEQLYLFGPFELQKQDTSYQFLDKEEILLQDLLSSPNSTKYTE